MKKRRAAIIGGSLAGLFTANLLRSIGWEADIFESVGSDLSSRGAGIATHAELLCVMRRLGITIDESIGVRVRSKICLDKSGNVVHEVPVDRIMTAWARFYRPLKDILPAGNYHYGKTLVRLEQDDHGATAFFSDGSRARADLLIGADGIRSAVRAQLMPTVQPRYAGYVAWRGIVEEKALPPSLHSEILEQQVFCLPEGEHMITHLMPGQDDDVRPGHRRYNFVWYHPVDQDRTLADLCTDASGKCHGISIPPPLIRPEVIAEIRAVAHELFPGQITAVVDLAPQPFFQAIFDLDSPRIVHGRVALVGDAAFVARPHVGMGVTKAALDAQYLADSIAGSAGDLDAALKRYDEARRSFGTRVVARSRRLGAHLEAQLKPREQRSQEELHQLPEVVLRQIGVNLSDIPELAT